MTFYSSRIEYWLNRKGTTSVVTPHGRHCPRYLAHVLRRKAYATRASVERWLEYHFAWEHWLPANWRALATCETRLRWDWDSGSYVSAFGIYRAGYSDDAHRIGALGWDESLRVLGRLPTPREQYNAALSHYRANGDGWGCPGP